MSDINEYRATAEYVKAIGRTYYYKEVLWFSFSASGAEFTFHGCYCAITIAGDASATEAWGAGHEARVAVYLNDEPVLDELINEENKTFVIYEGIAMKGRVRVVKLSEASDSTVGIQCIMTEGAAITPMPNKALRLEFIGDSITCGYGVDEELGAVYSTSNEDATKAYAYKTACKLNADYSLVAFSGYGIISGYTGDGVINTASLLPPYYDKLGRSYGKFAEGIAPDRISWDFNRFTPDIIVINLGTNDSSYCGTDETKAAAYQAGYKEFVKTVREKNPHSYIISTLGIMGDSLYPYLEAAVTEYRNETKDQRISTLKFAIQSASDGYAVDWHPSEKTHEKASDKLVEYIKELDLN
jgi:hypothetical protein